MAKHRHIAEEQPHKGHIDYLLLIIILMLAVFGIIMVFDSSIALLTDKYHFVILQSIWVSIGLIGMFVMAHYDYHKLAKLAVPLMIMVIMLLILVLVGGKSVNGAERWLPIGPFQLQPSELAKPIFILYLASWAAKEKPEFSEFAEKLRWNFFSDFLPFVIITGLIALLIIIGRDLGTAIIITVTALLMYYIQGTGFLSIMNVLSSICLFGVFAVLAIVFEPYRLQRILNFSGNANNPLKGGYQISQILIAIGSGGTFGKGFTQSIQKQRYLVETTAATDSIFAVIAEEFGFIGSLVLFIGYLFLFYRCIRIAMKAPDQLGRILAAGISIWIIMQTMLNIAVNVALVPLTGVPLPLISYGGSSVVILLSSLGIVLNISRSIHAKGE